MSTPNQPVDPTKDKRVHVSFYSVMHNPNDGSIWGTSMGFPGHVVRLAPGSDPTHTALTEIYEVPFPGYGPRGGDIDRNGIFWASLASGHLGKFDRSKCKVLNGPTATGKHCPEGWTLYRLPGPQFQDVQDDGSAEASYYTWVDWFDTFGLGKNVPIASGNMQRRLPGAGRRQVGHAARALSDGLLRQVGGRTHRRSECRLEGQGPVVDLLHPHGVPQRRRQGEQAARW